METEFKINFYPIKLFFIIVIAKSYSHVGRNKKGVKLETNFSVPLQSNWKSCYQIYSKPNSISSFVTILKAVMTKKIIVLENNSTKSWQCNYHDHIVRNHDSFDKFYQYIK
jgi:hypothetical protein